MGRVRVGLTMGDPCGIGPEILWNAYQRVFSELKYELEIFGDPRIYETLGIEISKSYRDLFSTALRIEEYSPVVEVGKETKAGGEHSLLYLEASVSAVKEGRVQALVNGPVSKSAVSSTLPGFRGHTYFYEEHLLRRGRSQAVMAFYGKVFSLVLLTHHLPLAKVSAQLGELDLSSLVHRSLCDFSPLLTDPRIAVCGFNPHAGEEGLLDCGEDKALRFMVAGLEGKGWNIKGPLPADTLFCPQVIQDFNLVISPYHDQGLIPFKMAHFPSGLGVTLGLQVPRLSVDHGTAYSLVGTGRASSTSLEEALLLMNEISGRFLSEPSSKAGK